MAAKGLIYISLGLALNIPFLKAEEPVSLFSIEGWNGYSYEENKKTVCFITRKPEKSEGNYTQRGPVSLKITYQESEKKSPEISFTAGYPYLKEGGAQFTMGKIKVVLFTDGDTAWTVDEKTDETLLKTLLKNDTLVVEGQSAKGTKTTDTFKVTGLKKALEGLKAACKKTF